MESLGVYLGYFGFADIARSVAQFVSGMQNPAIWKVFWRCLCFALSAAITAEVDTTGWQKPPVSYLECSP